MDETRVAVQADKTLGRMSLGSQLPASMRLEDRPEFSYAAGFLGGGSMALWQRRPGLAKPLTPRSRKKLIREARIKAAAEEMRRVEEAEAARRLQEERRRWEKEMERIRLMELAEEEARKLAKKRNDELKAQTLMRRVMKGWTYRYLFRWARTVPKLRRWVLREELMDYLDEVEELRSARQLRDDAAFEESTISQVLHKAALRVALKRGLPDPSSPPKVLQSGDDAAPMPTPRHAPAAPLRPIAPDAESKSTSPRHKGGRDGVGKREKGPGYAGSSIRSVGGGGWGASYVGAGNQTGEDSLQLDGDAPETDMLAQGQVAGSLGAEASGTGARAPPNTADPAFAAEERGIKAGSGGDAEVAERKGGGGRGSDRAHRGGKEAAGRRGKGGGGGRGRAGGGHERNADRNHEHHAPLQAEEEAPKSGEPILSPYVERWARANAEGRGGLLGGDERRIKGEAAYKQVENADGRDSGVAEGWRMPAVAAGDEGKGPLVNVEGDDLEEVRDGCKIVMRRGKGGGGRACM